MIRYLGGFLVFVLVGIPLLRAPSELVGGVGALAGVLCGVGVVTQSISFLAAGASLALAEYALALWMTAAPPDVVGAIGLGVTLWLLLELTSFAVRVHGLAVAPVVFREQVRSWIATGVAISVLGGVLAMGTRLVDLDLPGPARPAVVALGALAAFVGVVRALLSASSRPVPASVGEDH
jgi:hypothetical protein